MDSFKKLIDNFEKYLVITILGIMSILVIWQVAARFIFSSPLSWTEEAARYLMIWLTFFGGSIGVRSGAHVGVEIALRLLPKEYRKIGQMIGHIMGLIFILIIIIFGFKVVNMQIAMGQTSPAIGIPIWWAYLGVPVGSIFMFIRMFQNTWDTFTADEINFESCEVEEALELAKETKEVGV
jgi:C4-dicarboxylate transporter DctQ subunit